ncbi:methylamine utilization protein [Acidovorax sp. BL-A-41-H1]|uniref:methylamine utilization protein n=1 Tax=Acidovorax sp. BL-A-41-H1 TaxID=3421102 RepID=UPI003F7AE637
MARPVPLPAYGRAALLAWLVCGSAVAATVQVDVSDAEGRPLSDAIVYLESPEARKLVKPLADAEIVQEGRQFVPAVLVVPTGTAVMFPNRDKVRHHVYSFSPAKKFELKLYAGTPSSPVVFDQQGVVTLGCNIHDRMVGWVVVVDTPYFGRSAAGTGKLQIDNVPAGRYTLRTWHSRLPAGAAAMEQTLVVPATGSIQAAARVTGLQP